MASFASTTELGTYLGATFDTALTAQAQAMLDQATAEMKAYMHQDVVQVTNDVVTLDPSDSAMLILPQWPVTAVTAVVVDGVALTLPGDIRWYRDGRLRRDNGSWTTSWGWKTQSVVVTYTHGYATIPDDLKGVCKARAKRLMDNPSGISTEDPGNIALSDTGGETFLDGEKAVMDKYSDLVST